MDAGYTVEQLHDFAKQLNNGGCTPLQFKAAQGAGYFLSSYQASQGACLTAGELRDVGYIDKQLKGAGYNAKHFKDIGYSIEQLKDAGYC